MKHTPTYCNELQHTTTCCSILQHTVTYCSILEHTATFCNILQQSADYCSILQHTVTYLCRVVLQLLAASTEKSILNTVDEDNNTPLHVASEQGHTKVVRLLLQRGSDATQKNRLFLTPVACAAISGHYDVIDLLLENGAEIDPIDRNSVSHPHIFILKSSLF